MVTPRQTEWSTGYVFGGCQQTVMYVLHKDVRGSIAKKTKDLVSAKIITIANQNKNKDYPNRTQISVIFQIKSSKLKKNFVHLRNELCIGFFFNFPKIPMLLEADTVILFTF